MIYKRILLPLDGSELAERALPHAIAQAQGFGAELVLLRVAEMIAHTRGVSEAYRGASPGRERPSGDSRCRGTTERGDHMVRRDQ